MSALGPNARKWKPLGFALVTTRANQIKKELTQGERKPFRDVIDVSTVDAQLAGVKPLTFVRQVLSACLYPPLIHTDKLPVDVRLRAQRMLQECSGGSVGSYTEKIQSFPKIAEFITARDGGVASDPEHIYSAPGSMWGLTCVLKLLVNTSSSSTRTGVLVPVPCGSTITRSITELGGVVVPYHLSEEQGWELQAQELHRALEDTRGTCGPMALYVINPGNPTGHVQSRKSIQEVIRFASEERLFLLADEVYQDFVYGEHREFVSYKKVLAEMGPPLSHSVELASFHSASKGFMGECGLRGAYMEFLNVDAAVLEHFDTLMAKDSDIPALGLLALDMMTHPPQPGEPSYPLYHQETGHIRSTLVQNQRKALAVLNQLPGFCSQPVQGGLCVFPRLHLPPAAVHQAKEMGLEPDTFYCWRLLEEAGLLVSPGGQFGQKDGTHHIRLCMMTPQETMDQILSRLTNFHKQFFKDFS